MLKEELEIWRPVVGYEGRYEVSNLGNVRSLDWVETIKHPRNKEMQLTRKHRGKELRKRDDSNKIYYRVCLRKDGFSQDYSIHRLMMEAFVPNPLNLPCVNHKDENTKNNFIYVNPDGSVDLEKSNLEWCTYQYNLTYGTALDRRKEKLNKKVLCFSLEGKYVDTFKSLIAAAEFAGVSSCYIGECCRGRDCYPGGYKWVYEDD